MLQQFFFLDVEGCLAGGKYFGDIVAFFDNNAEEPAVNKWLLENGVVGQGIHLDFWRQGIVFCIGLLVLHYNS